MTPHWAHRVWRWYLLAAAGWLVFGAQALYFAHFQQVNMDEGAYLYAGLLFVKGVYHPFQAYGPWTNKMPVAFLLYGYLQQIFHPGLDTGRYFAVSSSMLALAGMWILARRFTNAKIAALTVWMVAATVALPRIYSFSVTESIVITLVIWSFVCILRERPRPWQLFIGGVLAGIISVTRINLIPVWLFVFLFTWKAYGLRRAAWAWTGALLAPLIVYAAYWPGILQLWAAWLPGFVRQWLPFDAVLPSIGYGRSADATTLAIRLSATADALRTHPLAWLSLTCATLLAWAWRRRHGFKYQVLKGLVTLTWMLVLIHAWATIGRGGLLVFNLGIYTAFFIMLIFVIGGIALQEAEALPSGRVSGILIGLVTAAILVSGFYTNNYLLKGYLASLAAATGHTAAPLLRWLPEVSRFRNPDILRGLLVFAAIGAALLGFLWPRLLRGWRQRTFVHWWQQRSRQARLGMLFLALGVLSPTPFFSASFHPYDCPQHDTLALHEQIGQQLQQVIPPGAKVYWQGIKSVTPLLYLPYDVQTFPPQYNWPYNYVQQGDPDTLYRLSYWNEGLARQWREEADVIVLSKGFLLEHPDFQQFLANAGFREYLVTAPLEPCKGEISRLAVYKR